MAENFDKIIEFIKSEKSYKDEDLDKILQEELQLSLADCSLALEASLVERAEELLEDLPNLAPFGDYNKMTEDPEAIVKFLREEASKKEHWKVDFIYLKKKEDQLLELIFNNKAVDDGDNVKGYIFVGLSGKIRHAFVQSSS